MPSTSRLHTLDFLGTLHVEACGYENELSMVVRPILSRCRSSFVFPVNSDNVDGSLAAASFMLTFLSTSLMLYSFGYRLALRYNCFTSGWSDL